MSQDVRVRTLCCPITDKWFVANRKACQILAKRRHDIDAGHGVPEADAEHLFDVTVELYKQMVTSRRLEAYMDVDCCLVPSQSCGSMARIRALVTIFREKIGAEVRTRFLNYMPAEMIVAIASYMDISTLRAWKRADSHVARSLTPRAPPKEKDWEKMIKKYSPRWMLVSLVELEFLKKICPVAYADDKYTFIRVWNDFMGSGNTSNASKRTMRPILNAIAKGDSRSIWNVLPDKTLFFYQMFDEAAAHGRFDFIKKILVMTPKEIWDKLGDYEIRSRNEGFPRPSPLMRMVKRGHFSHVSWFFSKHPDANVWDTCRDIRSVYNHCALRGRTEILEMKPDCCTKITLEYLVDKADSAEVLRWIQAHYPQKMSKHFFPLRHTYIGRLAMIKGNPKILDWLFESGFFDPDADGLRLMQEEPGFEAAQWIHDVTQKMRPRPSWALQYWSES